MNARRLSVCPRRSQSGNGNGNGPRRRVRAGRFSASGLRGLPSNARDRFMRCRPADVRLREVRAVARDPHPNPHTLHSDPKSEQGCPRFATRKRNQFHHVSRPSKDGLFLQCVLRRALCTLHFIAALLGPLTMPCSHHSSARSVRQEQRQKKKRRREEEKKKRRKRKLSKSATTQHSTRFKAFMHSPQPCPPQPPQPSPSHVR